jgi:LPXTG-site transpeptidase (sortase) family protein
MNQKQLIGITITIIALLVLGVTVRRAVYYAPDTEVVPPSTVGTTTTATEIGTAVTSSEKPARLLIPSLDISAAVQYVGVKANGAMANPSNFKDVGWYKYGTVPGREGSAVIAGHVDNALALDGVFKELGKIRVGDEVYVVRNDDVKLRFKVTRIEEYPYKEAPAQEIFATGGGKYLNLITCSGTWVKEEKSYDKRLVVYTALVE